jgi:hypothetical protein
LERDKSLAQSLVDSPETSAEALEHEAARLQSDLETEPELSSTILNPETVVHEAGQAVGRFRSQDGTLIVHDNLVGADHAVAVDPGGSSPVTNGMEPSSEPRRNGAEKSLRTAEELARKHLGNSARMSVAATDSGIYRGVVIGETEEFVLQQISKTAAIAHPKELLDAEPQAGQRLSITYSSSHAVVREIRERARAHALER